jgi:hypothetical protein
MLYLMWIPMFPLGITRITSLDMYYFLFPLFLYTTIIYLIHTQRTSYLTWIILAGAFSFIFIWFLEGTGNLFEFIEHLMPVGALFYFHCTLERKMETSMMMTIASWSSPTRNTIGSTCLGVASVLTVGTLATCYRTSSPLPLLEMDAVVPATPASLQQFPVSCVLYCEMPYILIVDFFNSTMVRLHANPSFWWR